MRALAQLLNPVMAARRGKGKRELSDQGLVGDCSWGLTSELPVTARVSQTMSSILLR